MGQLRLACDIAYGPDSGTLVRIRESTMISPASPCRSHIGSADPPVVGRRPTECTLLGHQCLSVSQAASTRPSVTFTDVIFVPVCI